MLKVALTGGIATGKSYVLARLKDPYDNALPSGNSVAIGVLLSR